MDNFAVMKVSIYTFGCKQNYAESSSIAQSLEEQGYTIVPFGEPADIVIVNTCTVTETADRECRKIIHRARRSSPNAAVIVTGCYAQLQPDEVAAIEGVSLVVGNAEKHHLSHLVADAVNVQRPLIIRTEDLRTAELAFTPAMFADHDSHTRAFLKLQDGCDYACSFCTIPHARGKSRSMPFNDIPQHVRRLVEAGYREIVLTGINLGEYRAPTGERLLDVLRLLISLPYECRYRLSSIEPNRLHPDMIAFVAEHPSICPHFHLPLQSGSPEILRAMRRRYKREQYAERVHLIKELLPHACIGADVLTGFPGETERHFQETVEFIAELPLSYLHVFTYSEREMTPAAHRVDRLPYRIRKERTAYLRKLSAEKRHTFYQQNVGALRRVLVEGYDCQAGGWVGYTENYCRTSLPAAKSGELLEVRITGFDGDYLRADYAASDASQASYVALPVIS